MMKIDSLCIRCKGRDWCGKPCPILNQIGFKTEQLGKKDFFGSSPAPFVGHYGYPELNVGILSTEDSSAWLHDAPRYWAEEDYGIAQIAALRSTLVNSRFRVHVKESTRFLEISKEVGMASRPVDVEVNLKKKPVFKLDLQPFVTPMGPSVELVKAVVTENPKIDQKVERVVSDTDLKASNAIIYLYRNRFDENFLTRLLSIGNLGLKRNRRLVPTRWSITAIDDTLGKSIARQIKDYRGINYQLYFGDYLGNYYLIMFIPDAWSYELFEMYMPKASWNQSNTVQYTTDYESYMGRKDYAKNCAGGYYSVRLAVLEKLAELKRRGSALTMRFITDEYTLPLGVWVTREAARMALKKKPIEFNSLELMLDYAKSFIIKKFGYNLERAYKNSRLLTDIRTQKRLSDFL